jgi:hypothetical protein
VIDRTTTRDTPINSVAPPPGRSVVWNSGRGNHLGQRSCANASIGRTYGRNDLIKTLQNTLRGGGRPHMSFGHSGPPKNRALPDSLALAEVSGPGRLTTKFDRLQTRNQLEKALLDWTSGAATNMFRRLAPPSALLPPPGFTCSSPGPSSGVAAVWARSLWPSSPASDRNRPHRSAEKARRRLYVSLPGRSDTAC